MVFVINAYAKGMKMTHQAAKEMIEDLGWVVIAQKRHSGNLISFDATNYRRLAKGQPFMSNDDAMSSCLRRVRELCL